VFQFTASVEWYQSAEYIRCNRKLFRPTFRGWQLGFTNTRMDSKSCL